MTDEQLAEIRKRCERAREKVVSEPGRAIVANVLPRPADVYASANDVPALLEEIDRPQAKLFAR